MLQIYKIHCQQSVVKNTIVLKIKKKKWWIKNMIVVIYLLKLKNMINSKNKIKNKVNHSQNKLFLR